MTLKEFKSRYDSNRLQYVNGKKTNYPFPMKDKYGLNYKIIDLYEDWNGNLISKIIFEGGYTTKNIYK